MSDDPLRARATDPRQYDRPELDWTRQGAPDSASSRAYQVALREALAGVRVTAAVDIGCGLGPLEPLLRELGAQRVVGIEPSAQSAAIARRSHPAMEVIESPLETVTLDGGFDLAVAVMSFEHQPDLAAAFRNVSRLLVSGGRFALITGDPDFHRTPHLGLSVDARYLPDGSIAVATSYPFGTIHDLVRSPEQIVTAATGAGFVVERRIPLMPTPLLIEDDPGWREIADRPYGHLFVLRSATSRST